MYDRGLPTLGIFKSLGFKTTCQGCRRWVYIERIWSNDIATFCVAFGSMQMFVEPVTRIETPNPGASTRVEITDSANFWPGGDGPQLTAQDSAPVLQIPSPPLTVSSGPVGALPCSSYRLAPVPTGQAPITLMPPVSQPMPPVSQPFQPIQPIPQYSSNPALAPQILAPPQSWPEFHFTVDPKSPTRAPPPAAAWSPKRPKSPVKGSKYPSASGRELQDMERDVLKLSEGQEQLWQEFQHLKRAAQSQNQSLDQLKGQLGRDGTHVEQEGLAGTPGMRRPGVPGSRPDTKSKMTKVGSQAEEGVSQRKSDKSEKPSWDESVADCLFCK